MLLLFETSAGFALFKVLQEGVLTSTKPEDFDSLDAGKLVALQSFTRFENTAEALEACSALVESKLSRGLRHFLKKNIVKKDLSEETLAVFDAKVGGLIKEKLGIACTSGGAVQELMRCVRSKVDDLLAESTKGASDIATSSLGLAHSFSRYKLKFSPEKVDTMIVQAISLLDDLDKEINTYCMRVREWYGWHFPEMSKVIPDNMVYCKLVQRIGMRAQAPSIDLSDLVPEEVETEVKELSQVSMGTEISAEDVANVSELCQQVIDITAYREQLWDYLRSRMAAIAPNLSTLVGELVGARLIAHTGSLISLAKYPASTIQILGAEKALFRALKSKKKTPKYGLIYHASLIGQAPAKGKGQISRVLAAKAALCARVDALAEAAVKTEEDGAETEAVPTTVGIEGRSKVEARIRTIEGQALKSAAGGAKSPAGKPTKYEAKTEGGMGRVNKSYDSAHDSTMTPKKKTFVKAEPVEEEEEKKRQLETEEAPAEASETPAKKKKKKSLEESTQ